jgi:hypothetical protein
MKAFDSVPTRDDGFHERIEFTRTGERSTLRAMSDRMLRSISTTRSVVPPPQNGGTTSVSSVPKFETLFDARVIKDFHFS